MRLSVGEIRNLVPPGFDDELDRDIENFKEVGRTLQRTAESIEDRSKGVLVEIYCHFLRSRRISLANKRKHPEFDEYAVHWLHFDPERHSLPEFALLVSQVPRPDKLRIDEAGSQWSPRARKP